MGTRAEYVRINGSGKNALDFHIAYYLGQLATQHPDAAFHVISRDTGFDPLVAFMRGRGIPVDRLASLEAMAPGRSGGGGAKSAPVAKHPASTAGKATRPAAVAAKKPVAAARKSAPAKGAAKAGPQSEPHKDRTAKPVASKVDDYIAVFGRPNAPHAKTEATLASSIRNHFGKNIAAKDIAEIIRGLVARGFVSIAGGKVTYKT
jgi:hypothetical protein